MSFSKTFPILFLRGSIQRSYARHQVLFKRTHEQVRYINLFLLAIKAFARVDPIIQVCKGEGIDNIRCIFQNGTYTASLKKLNNDHCSTVFWTHLNKHEFKNCELLNLYMESQSKCNTYQDSFLKMEFFLFKFRREIVECQKGVIPDVPYPQCRCPESHPRISPSNVFHCMKNGAQSSQRIERYI